MKLNIRKHWKGWLIGGIIAAVVLVVGVPYLYIHVYEGDQPAALALSDSSTSTSDAAAVPVDGTWKVGSGSAAGYRVHETLAGQSVTAVGRGSGVTGTVAISGTQVTNGTITIDMTTVRSDKGARDDRFRTSVMDTARYPTGTFTLTRPVRLGSVPAPGRQVSAQATGDLTLHGVTRQVTFTVKAERTGSTIQVAGDIPITFADYGVQAPNFAGFVTVDDSGQVEFLLNLTRS